MSRFEGKLTSLNGEARLEYPTEARGVDETKLSLEIRPTVPGVMLRIKERTKDFIDIQLANEDGELRLEPTELHWVVTVKADGSYVLKRALDLPPKIATTYSFLVVNDRYIFDFGYIAPFTPKESLPEYSIDVHTRLQMDEEMAYQLYSGLKDYFESTGKA